MQDLRFSLWCCWRFKASSVLCSVEWEMLTFILHERCASIVRVKLGSEGGATVILWNFCNHLLVDTAWHAEHFDIQA